jgi:hypothetical protein
MVGSVYVVVQGFARSHFDLLGKFERLFFSFSFFKGAPVLSTTAAM